MHERFPWAARVAGALLLGAVVQALSPSAAAAGPPLERVAGLAQAAPPGGAVDLGPLGPSAAVDLGVVLAPSDPVGLRARLASLYDPSSPTYHRWLAPGRFLARYGPAPTEVAAVRAWLRSEGLGAGAVHGFTVETRVRAAVLARALGVRLERYRAAGGTGYLARGAPTVPRSLASGTVQDLLGLDTMGAVHPDDAAPAAPLPRVAGPVPRSDGLSPCSGAADTAASGYYTLDALGAAYGIGSLLSDGLDGHGLTIGLYELGAHSPADVSTYASCFGLADPVTTVEVDGGAQAGTVGTAEADLDIEQAATQAPGASIVSYEGPGTAQGAYDTWARAVDQDVAQVVSSSWGECEAQAEGDGTMGAYTTLFEQAAMQGQTVLAATGDSGAEGCYSFDGSGAEQVTYPASDPWATAVGGTSLFAPGDETAWNSCQSDESAACAAAHDGVAAGGGGVSRYEARPAYQPGVVGWPAAQPCGTSCRQTPDIAANAGVGMVVFVNGAWVAEGGTSFAAPFMAGLVADADDGCRTTAGDWAPTLYALAAAGVDGTAFTDVTQGDTDMTGTNGGAFAARPGYDAATGLGSPLASGLSCPEVTGVQPPDAAPGSTVTVSGLGLEKATFSFGSATAAVLAQDATAATVVVPAGSGTVTIGASSAAGAGTQAAPFSFDAATTPAPAPVPASASGYDMVGRDGGVFVFPGGAAGGFYGSLPGLGVHVDDVVGMVPTADERGYFLVGADGGVFAFGDAAYLGSLPGEGIVTRAVVGIAATPDGGGYWVVGSNGAVAAFGDARSLGSMPPGASPVAGIAATPDGQGYWVVTADGDVDAFGDAGALGSLAASGATPAAPVTALVPTADAGGYWLVGTDGGIFAYGDAPFVGSLPALSVHVTDIVAAVPTRA